MNKKLYKQYLTDLNEIENAFIGKDVKNQKLLNFWKGLVRDSEGKWLKYYFEGYKYFQYGNQPKPDLIKPSDISLIKAAIRQNKAFAQGIVNQSYLNFKPWLIKLHKKQIYNGQQVKIATKKRFALIIHSRIVLDAIIPLAIKYNDPYINRNTQKVCLPQIDNEGFPVDIWQNKNEVSHYYPDPKFIDQYLKAMKELLQAIVANSDISQEDLLSKIALYYQYAINTHMFENINQSLFANQVNVLLQVFGYKPINHGILDFVALRFQPVNFIKYFVDEVIETKNNRLKSTLSREDERYLELSQLK